MKGKVVVQVTTEDAARLEQAFKDGRLNALVEEFGIEGIEFPSADKKKQWADPALEKRGNLKSDDSGPKLP